MFQRVQCEPIYIYTLCCDLIFIEETCKLSLTASIYELEK